MSIPKLENPTWHGLIQGKMPSFPQEIVYGLLDRFGITNPKYLEPWPAGPFDILASFKHKNAAYLLKVRFVEQRGLESLFETQKIQQALLQLGFPVPELFRSPTGETLLEGPNWKECEHILYEIQSVLPGESLHSHLELTFLAGKFLGTLHTLGEKIDSQLMSKFYNIDHFINIFPRQLQQFSEESKELPSSIREEIHAIINRLSDSSWRSSLTQRLTHGDFNNNNILVHNEKLALVDLDELGYGIAVLDIVWGLKDICQCDIDLSKAFLAGYKKTGANLHTEDLQAIRYYLTACCIKDFPFSELATRIDQLLSK